MPTKMNNQRPAGINTGGRVTISMVHALDRFIESKIIEYGWVPTYEDEQDLRSHIIRNLLELCCIENSERFILEAHSERETHRDMAEWISEIFLGNTAPNDRCLLSFTDGVVQQYHDLCQEHFDRHEFGFQGVADHDVSSHTQASAQTEAFPLLRLPAELRNMVYREALVVSTGDVLRSFAPPAMLCTSKVLRDEATRIFYGENRFEITVKRSPMDESLAAGTTLSCVDMWAWRRFIHMWDTFNCFGSNCLRYVRHVKLIYQLSMDIGFSFGDGEFDKRLGFRCSSDPFEEDCERKHGRDDDGESPSDSGYDLEDGAGALDEEDSNGENSTDQDNSGDEENGELDQVPEDDSEPVGVFELTRKTPKWRSLREAQFFLFHTMCEYGTDQMWEFYPLKRLGRMLWRCARDCPLVTDNIDLICEDLPYWMDSIGRDTRYEPVEFGDLVDEDA